ncbi:MAG: TolB family protein [Dehalococcoidia bacterium]
MINATRGARPRQDRRGVAHLRDGWPARVALSGLIAIAGVLLACGTSGARGVIVYEAARGETVNIYTIDPSSGATTQLTHGTKFDGNPAWSADRGRIIFASNRDGQAQTDIYSMDRSGGGVRRLTDTPDAGEYSPKYSPDGKTVAYVRQSTGGWTVWRMDASGRDQRQLAGPYAFAEFPAWTHDGSEVYYSAIETGEATGRAYGNAHIYSVNVTTMQVRARIETKGPDVCPHFSRDGGRLTYAAPGPSGSLNIFAHDLSNPDTSGARDAALTTTAARDDYANASPDDRTMVFVSDRDGNPELYLMDRDGAHQRRLTHTPDLKENVPDW